MPKKRQKHDKTDLDKINKILVETNINPKKVSQWTVVAKSTITPQVLSVKGKSLFCKFNNAKSKGEKVLEEDKLPEYRSDERYQKRNKERDVRN